jgi:non-specific serine/threonine protein kinase
LGAAIDRSYNLLSGTERVMLRRLSVFAGGWTLEAAESVCAGAGVEMTSILDVLTSLVDKSLVQAETLQGEARYRLLETVRQYARDRLAEAGEESDVRARHRDWYLALAEQAWPELFGPQSGLWLERLETEHDNMRAALEQSKTDTHGAEAVLRLAGALFWFWTRHGNWNEAGQWLAGALARSAEAPPAALPRVLAGMAQFAWRHDGDYETAETLAEKGLTVYRQLGDTDDRDNEENAAILLYQSSVAVMRRGDSTRATALLNQCLTLCNELGHKWMRGIALAGLGQVTQYFSSDYDCAKALFTESLAWFREAGDSWGIAYGLRNLGFVAVYQGDCERAAASFKESLELCKAIRERWLSGECVKGLAWVDCASQNYERAARLFGAAELACETLGYHPAPFIGAYHDRYVASTRAALGDLLFAAAWTEGRAMTLEQAIEYALGDQTGRPNDP